MKRENRMEEKQEEKIKMIIRIEKEEKKLR
jgi:hypothetical protein